MISGDSWTRCARALAAKDVADEVREVAQDQEAVDLEMMAPAAGQAGEDPVDHQVVQEVGRHPATAKGVNRRLLNKFCRSWDARGHYDCNLAARMAAFPEKARSQHSKKTKSRQRISFSYGLFSTDRNHIT
jgi:hypothetical protein